MTDSGFGSAYRSRSGWASMIMSGSPLRKGIATETDCPSETVIAWEKESAYRWATASG